MRLIDADALKEKFKEHYDLFVSAYKNEQDMSLADKSRVDERVNSRAEVINAPTIFDTDNATNGEVIEKVFNTTSTQFYELVRMDNIDNGLCCSLDWWNSPYE